MTPPYPGCQHCARLGGPGRVVRHRGGLALASTCGLLGQDALVLASAQLAGREAKAFVSGPLCQPVADPRGNLPNVVGVPVLAPAGIVIERMEAVGRRPPGLPERPEQVAEMFGGEIPQQWATLAHDLGRQPIPRCGFLVVD
jgi:hypothetical protein